MSTQPQDILNRGDWRKPPPSAPNGAPARRPPFPRPLRINGLKLYRRSALDHFKTCLEAHGLGQPLPPKPPIPDGDPLVSHRKVAAEFSTTTRSIDRWVAASSEAVATSRS
jgi:hypothetical protein